MPVPKFNKYGLLPAGIHICTLGEIQEIFCWNIQRQAIWNGLIEFLRYLKSMDLAYPVYLDGGFSTDKDYPEDIDLAHDVTAAMGYNQYRSAKLFMQHRNSIKQSYHVDFCTNLPGNNDFASFFQYAGPKTALIKGLNKKTPKGILRVESSIWVNGLNK